MTALTQALEAAQAKVVAAYAKKYVRGSDDPSDDADEGYRALFRDIGLDDAVTVRQLLLSWRLLRLAGEQPPGEQAPRTEKNDAPASDAQWSLIRKLADEKGTTAPDGVLTKADAHTIIDQLKAGTYNPDDWYTPF